MKDSGFTGVAGFTTKPIPHMQKNDPLTRGRGALQATPGSPIFGFLGWVTLAALFALVVAAIITSMPNLMDSTATVNPPVAQGISCAETHDGMARATRLDSVDLESAGTGTSQGVQDMTTPTMMFLIQADATTGQDKNTNAQPPKVYTPARGSAERTAIADAMRAHVQGRFQEKMPKFLFVIEHLKVKGEFAAFGGYPVTPAGKHIDEYWGDMVYNCLLLKKNGKWQVVLDLTRGDVPSDEEVKQLKASVPPGFPPEVVSDFWRKFLF